MRNKIKKRKKENIWKKKATPRSAPVKSREDDASASTGKRRPRWGKNINRKGGGESAGKKEKGKTGEGGKASSGRWRARTTVLAAVFLVSLAVLLWIYTGTGVLNVRHIEIRGNQKLDVDYLESLTGITPDTHLLKMDVKAVERALCSDAYIQSVSISRRFPATVILEISERSPQGMIIQNGKYHLVDSSGYILESLSEMPQGVVEIRDIEIPMLFPGKEVSGEAFTSAIALLGSLPPELKGMTEAVGNHYQEGLYLASKGTKVIYGDTSDLSKKNTVALLALRDLVDNYAAIEYVDVSLPDHPVLKPAQILSAE